LQPNSIVFGTVAELGGLGALLLAGFVIAVAVAMWRVRRRGGEPPTPSIVAAVGVAAAALSYATTDWVWVGMPGVMAMGLLAVGVVLAASDRAGRLDRPRRRGRPVPTAWRLGVVGVAVIAAVLLGRQAIASALRHSATHNLVAHPAQAVDRADASIAVDPQAVDTYYVKAAALARQGKADQARAVLVDARKREPDNFVTWALLGDLDVRRADLAQAGAEYRQAARLNPLDAGSNAGIPTDPKAAVALVGPRPLSIGRRPNLIGYQIVKDTSPLELARALGAPGLRASDQVVVGLFGYGID
jgi:hypothetical protein